ncbi:DUF262 domain-containing protein [Kosakonia sp. CFBP8986]|uniref:DUF262 domain-containing protein n=1 Tax=Kosakonia sp. CFBP8986 TaxID=3096524 RepID=UPI002A6B7DE9|nr:DUF262 domain-containing protein [Kosakonia sp. CFBP8986]MDY0887519.1 DUF262 domain-containing protein [Kosakonia sp. CFBP8986]
MNVKPDYMSFGELFKNNNVFYTPKYQRDYSWEDEQIEQFCNDIQDALDKKRAGRNCEHFFGGVVCAQEKTFAAHTKIENLLVDGQQRLSTIVLFFSVIRDIITNLKCDEDKDSEYIGMILKDIEKYFTFEERENRQIKKHVRIIIGSADNDFYQSLIDAKPLKAVRHSHKLMLDARKSFLSFLREELFKNKKLSECLEIIDDIVKLFEESFLVIHIVTNSIEDAYKLFTVLNDRGINLTEGELLKAHTIGICHNEPALERSISDNWDYILQHPSKKVTDYLRWILIMLTGNNYTASSVLGVYKNNFFNETRNKEEVCESVAFIRECVERLEFISNGEWPFDNEENNNWHKSKLDLIINRLKHLYAMPLLLAASFSSEKNFKDIISEVCKFFIRCKMITDLHATIFAKLYSTLANKIHLERDRFELLTLLNEFSKVISDKDPDDIKFMTGIRGLTYQKKGDNKALKCFLLTIQENWEWLSLPCQGSSLNRLKKEDHNLVYDFNSMTLEHIYPYSAAPQDKNIDMEKIKNSIGNIVLLDPGRNNKNENKMFSDKRNNFENTGIGMHSFIHSRNCWDEGSIRDLADRYVELAVKVFSFN